MLGPDGWGTCDPSNPKNRRRRPSILVEAGGTRLLVDTSPDLREQLLAANIWEVDAVLYTHAHADHVNGIDDIRSMNYHRQGPIDAYGSRQTLDDLELRFAYVFQPYGATPQFFRPCLTPREIDGPFRIGAIDIVPFHQEHGRMPSLGFRFNNFAYSTDVKALPEASFAVLEGVEAWIVDCLSETPHPAHSHLAQTLDWIDRVAPKRAVLNHLSQRMDYQTLVAKLPSGVEPAYDGMVFEVADV
jgi:phosphoribosyl 1,2-cyclic phosphate phosphodiesterase